MNQYNSIKGRLLRMLDMARENLEAGYVEAARLWLWKWRIAHCRRPASTRRRWRCGR